MAANPETAIEKQLIIQWIQEETLAGDQRRVEEIYTSARKHGFGFSCLSTPNEKNQSSLFLAAVKGHKKIIDWLLQQEIEASEEDEGNRFDLNLQCAETGKTVLHAVISTCSDNKKYAREVVSKLLRTNFELSDKDGKTGLSQIETLFDHVIKLEPGFELKKPQFHEKSTLYIAEDDLHIKRKLSSNADFLIIAKKLYTSYGAGIESKKRLMIKTPDEIAVYENSSIRFNSKKNAPVQPSFQGEPSPQSDLSPQSPPQPLLLSPVGRAVSNQSNVAEEIQKAAATGQLNLVEELYNTATGNPNSTVLTQPNDKNQNALFLAATGGKVGVLDWMLKRAKGASEAKTLSTADKLDLQCSETGQTLLHAVINNFCTEDAQRIVPLLLGTNLALEDYEGISGLDLIKSLYEKVVTKLPPCNRIMAETLDTSSILYLIDGPVGVCGKFTKQENICIIAKSIDILPGTDLNLKNLGLKAKDDVCVIGGINCEGGLGIIAGGEICIGGVTESYTSQVYCEAPRSFYINLMGCIINVRDDQRRRLKLEATQESTYEGLDKINESLRESTKKHRVDIENIKKEFETQEIERDLKHRLRLKY